MSEARRRRRLFQGCRYRIPEFRYPLCEELFSNFQPCRRYEHVQLIGGRPGRPLLVGGHQECRCLLSLTFVKAGPKKVY